MEAAWTEFARLAGRYCDLLESFCANGPVSLLEIQITLVELYSAALRLPNVDLIGDSAESDSQRPTHHEWSVIYKAADRRLNGLFYWMIYEPFLDPPEEPVASTLASDFADIWRDLKEGLLLKPESGSPQESHVRWDWKFSFETHWGRHTIDALAALHRHPEAT